MGLVKGHGHTVQLAIGLSLTLSNKLLELDIVVEVLLVTLVAKFDHAGHLSVHIGVNLSLGGTVGADNTSSVVNPVVHLGHLLLHSGRELEETDLKLSLSSSDLLLGISLGSSNVANSLSITVSLKSLLGIEGSLEAHGGLLQCHVNLVTVLGHLGLDIVELSSIGSDMLVHAVDAGIGGRGPGRGGSLPTLDSHAEVVGSLAAVVGRHLNGAAVTTESGTVATVSKASLLSETLLCLAHSVVEIITALLSIHSHLVQHLPLELGTSCGIEREVASHLGADRRNVGLAVCNLVGNLLLDVVEVVHQAHAAIRGLGVDLPGLEDIGAAHRGASIVALDDLVDVLLASIGGNVHDGAAHS